MAHPRLQIYKRTIQNAYLDEFASGYKDAVFENTKGVLALEFKDVASAQEFAAACHEIGTPGLDVKLVTELVRLDKDGNWNDNASVERVPTKYVAVGGANAEKVKEVLGIDLAPKQRGTALV